MKPSIAIKIIFASIMTSSLTLIACQSPNSKIRSKTHNYSLGLKCPTLLNMKVGETLYFNALENPSTGYQWMLLQPLKLFKTQESFQPKENDDGIVGVGGEKNYYFEALKPGQELIELVYVRPWESSRQAEQQWQCHVRIS